MYCCIELWIEKVIYIYIYIFFFFFFGGGGGKGWGFEEDQSLMEQYLKPSH